MCYYITLIVPSADQAAIHAVMQGHRRAAMPFDNSSVAQVLLAGERQYLTTYGFCDCGTALVEEEPPAHAELEEELAREAAALRRKGWPEAKIARVIEERRSAHDRGALGEKKNDPDSLKLWARIITDLHRDMSLPYVGLLVHRYNGRLDDEEFHVLRRDAPIGLRCIDQLGALKPDEVTIFRRG